MYAGMIDGKPGHACLTCGTTVFAPAPKAPVQKRVTSPELDQSTGEQFFLHEWYDRYPLLPPVPQYQFHTFRNWALDFAWPKVKVAVEMESSVHRTKGRFATDIPKYNALSEADWLLFRTTRDMLARDCERFMRMVAETIERRGK